MPSPLPPPRRKLLEFWGVGFAPPPAVDRSPRSSSARRIRWWLAAALCSGAVGCADLLGLDDGIPRTDGGGVADAAPTTDRFAPLHCGSSTCNFAAVQSCCWDDEAGTETCKNANEDCGGLYVPCDRSSQCAQGGEAGPIVCCADYEANDAGAITATGVSCVPASDCTRANLRFVLCGDGTSADCQGDASCVVSDAALPTFSVCQ